MKNRDKRIYLVRHGQVHLPDLQQRYYLGQTDVPLTERGIRQAVWLQQFFAELPQRQQITAIYHSPLQRCAETARQIAGGRWPTIAAPDLQEIGMGQWEMLPMEQIRTQQPEAYRLRGEYLDTFCPPDGESFAQCQQRSVAAFQQIVEQMVPGSAVVIVAHAGVNRCLLSWISGQPLKQLLSIPQPYGCVTALTWQGQNWQVGPLVHCPV
ncbi:MAG: histidine phosphatase family protein [Peptococcaceae bacterium]